MGTYVMPLHGFVKGIITSIDTTLRNSRKDSGKYTIRREIL